MREGPLNRLSSRWRMDAIEDSSKGDGFSIEISPQREKSPASLLVSQDIAISVTTDEKGNILAGKPWIAPQTLDSFT